MLIEQYILPLTSQKNRSMGLIFFEVYVVYLRLNEQFEKVWSFSGGDIFVSQNGQPPFELENDK